MAETTAIAWTDATFNPWIGCTKVHDGCTTCYAESYANRYGKAKWGPGGTRVKTSDANWQKPLLWNRWRYEHHAHVCDQVVVKDGKRWHCSVHGECHPDEIERVEFDASRHRRHRVFCASLADVFEDWEGDVHAPNGDTLYVCNSGEHAGNIGDFPSGIKCRMHHLRTELFQLIDATPNLDWLLLTKRPENVRRMWPVGEQSLHKLNYEESRSLIYRENCWLGTSISDQHTADVWVPRLLECRGLSPVLFLSVEPLLGPVDLTRLYGNISFHDHVDLCVDALRGTYAAAWSGRKSKPDWPLEPLGAGRVDQVILGCESNGPRVGRMGAFRDEAHWWEGCADIVQQCRAAGTAAFVKQGPRNGKVCHDLEQFPESCRVRQFPEPHHA